MASKRAAVPAKHLFNGFRAYEQPMRQFQPCLTRSMATEAPLPGATLSKSYSEANLDSAPTQPIIEDRVAVPAPAPSRPPKLRHNHEPPQNPFLKPAQCTLYNFPSLEPVGFTSYPPTHLSLPLRKDILHKAVIYEGDSTRQGSANTKWRSEVHGSNRKIRPQKGTGSARLGDKKSPMLRGGGVAFGPKPRDFSTELPRKIYDLAWRTALSYRYKMGELIVTDSEIDVPGVSESSLERYVRDVLKWNGLGREGGKTLFVTDERREGLFSALEGDNMHRQARALEVEWVDVKDLLETGRVVVERTALEAMFEEHESDLGPRQRFGAWEFLTPELTGIQAEPLA
ncbi:54S ribosomal protein yml6, mitochondrial [Fulvia fulva]|uniref:Large ribosomal subunit protein uL4m n=1 Tax=Passalora fulva TaxID=5499 RepID=A0A9Q8L9R7_PASFU|nr:54S ribosomal protein yml6, mitochondrial [Fulvia fulva]KAK4631353.1 54S ribosomal protein yml6, mitochondrial [Fulvia fulva]KAK4633980.1 54S ribosomal protein yml6, mitochondrial [Fulvia fulva]UJO13376.1 54S ribosomal protein yml6, mitochondrial [Fulvia fulva]WPV10971.1 54S ribosomal protein yml6, mitochondrial [Fulvia fulva]WPV25791.1 54S ribosomal protein yml6, mitochondrial [Fulvia fulva]